MNPTTLDVNCVGYAVKTDVYEASEDGPILLHLIGRTSNRSKQRYHDSSKMFADELGITTAVFDYSGHGDSPFNLEDISAAQHFIEVVTVFDWIAAKYPNRKIIVIGSSYGGYLATQLTKYREFDLLVLRGPAIYRPQDFYTLNKNEDSKATMAFRQNTEALAKHPLLVRASNFKGKSLVVAHEHDEHIPKETTDAYVNTFGAEEIVIKNITHSLDDDTQEQIDDYFKQIFNWLSKEINS